jgi:asparagine synthase (glutamine-hydrolysing)
VILVGEGSDEQFLGYDSRVSFLRRYRRTWRPLLALPRPVLQAGRAMAHAAQGLLKVGGRYEQILNRALRGEEVFLGSLAFPQEAKDRLLTPEAAAGQERSQAVVEEIMRTLRTQWPQADIATRMMYLDLKIRLAELLLVRVDKITMSVSLEAREPFMDYRLVEYTLALPWEFKLRGSDPKYVLKRATEDLLPASVIQRPKKAFAAPVEDWFRGKLSQFASRTILNSGLRKRGVFRYDVIEHLLDRHQRGEAEHGVQIWTLLNLSAWYDQWISA